MKIDLTFRFFLFLLLGAYIDPFGAFAEFLLAAGLHELGHFCAARLLGGTVQAVRFGFGDVQMQIGFLPKGKEIAVLLAGPCVNFACFFLFRRIFAALAVLSLLLGAFNLLPILPLDGGKVMLTYLSNSKVVLAGSIFGAAALLGAAVWAVLRLESGLWPVAAALAVLARLLLTAKTEKAVAFPL